MWVCAFDIETCSADEFHRRPDFTRLYGYTDRRGEIRTTEDPHELIEALLSADAVTAHFGSTFDALAMAKHYSHAYDGTCGMPLYETLMLKMWDTAIVEKHLNPVAAKGAQPNGFYELDSLAARYGVGGKTGDIRKMARHHGGFDMIPLDDYDYVQYLIGDVACQRDVQRAQAAIVAALPDADRAYIRREHAVAAVMGRIALEAMRVDVDETMRRHAAGQARLEASKQRLHEEHGMPLEGAFPHRSNLGKAAFRRALLATGISESALTANWPVGKDGSLLTGKDVLKPMVELFERRKPEAADLCRTILAMNGERSIYGTALKHLVDGRVHLDFKPEQASGRWSNWVTVFGKRGGKHVERCIMLADSDDEVLVAIDADQVDARVVAAECQDPAYMELFLPGRDLHSEVAWLIWSAPDSHGPDCTQPGGVHAKCKCPRRDQAKVSAHGWGYGLQPAGMARQQGVDISVTQQFDAGMRAAFPRYAAWRDETRALAGALPYGVRAPSDDSYRILHTWAGRPVRVERERAFTQATAVVGQGGTRDVMAQAALGLPFAYRRRIRAVIHDEFVFSLPAATAEADARRIADMMSFDLRGVRITFGVSKPGRNWGECYSK